MVKLDKKVTRRLNKLKAQQNAFKKDPPKEVKKSRFIEIANTLDRMERLELQRLEGQQRQASATGRFPTQNPEYQELPKTIIVKENPSQEDFAELREVYDGEAKTH